METLFPAVTYCEHSDNFTLRHEASEIKGHKNVYTEKRSYQVWIFPPLVRPFYFPLIKKIIYHQQMISASLCLPVPDMSPHRNTAPVPDSGSSVRSAKESYPDTAGCC